MVTAGAVESKMRKLVEAAPGPGGRSAAGPRAGESVPRRPVICGNGDSSEIVRGWLNKAGSNVIVSAPG